MPSVEQLPSGRYRALAWNPVARKYEKVPNPEPGSRGTYEEWNQANAAALAAEKKVDDTYTEAGVAVNRLVRRIPFPEYADVWWHWYQENEGGNPQTDHSKYYHVQALKREFKESFVDDITENVILQKDGKWKQSGLSASSRKGRIGTLRKIMRKAIRDTLRESDPTLDISVKMPRSKPRPIAADRFAYLTYFMPEFFWPLAVMAYHTGMRAEEVAGLRWFRLIIDGPDPVVHVKDVMQIDHTIRPYTKAGEGTERWVPLAPEAVVALKWLRDRLRGGNDRPEDFVLRNSRNRAFYNSEYISVLMLDAHKASGLPGENDTFHMLRHAVGSGLAEAGATAWVIRDVLGHANVATSQIYVDETPRQMQRHFLLKRSQGTPFDVVDGEKAS